MTKIAAHRSLKYHYSPLRYPGGKTLLFPFFDKVIKDHKLKNITYVEPFAGGSGAALALLFLEKVDKVVINDLDRAIYSFWKYAIFSSERFIKMIYSVPVTISEWEKQKKVYSNPHANQFALGFATFFLNRTNISGILEGGAIGGKNQTGKWKIDARFNKDGLAKRIHQLSQYKNRISVTNRDGVELINDFIKKKNAFIYLDPPYYEKGSTLYLNHYNKNNHQILANKLNQNPNSYWLLTYDNKKEIRLLYPLRKIVNFSLNYNAYESRKGKEVMIFSDALAI